MTRIAIALAMLAKRAVAALDVEIGVERIRIAERISRTMTRCNGHCMTAPAEGHDWEASCECGWSSTVYASHVWMLKPVSEQSVINDAEKRLSNHLRTRWYMNFPKMLFRNIRVNVSIQVAEMRHWWDMNRPVLVRQSSLRYIHRELEKTRFAGSIRPIESDDAVAEWVREKIWGPIHAVALLAEDADMATAAEGHHADAEGLLKIASVSGRYDAPLLIAACGRMVDTWAALGDAALMAEADAVWREKEKICDLLAASVYPGQPWTFWRGVRVRMEWLEQQ